MGDFILEAELREKTGRGESRRLRRTGKLPAVIYGGGKPELPIVLDALNMSKLVNNEAFHSSIIKINVGGSRGINSGLVKDIQWDPVHDTPLHIDFHRVSSSDTVHMEVPMRAINSEKCPGVVRGGLVEVIRHTLEVTCRADSIPEGIEVNCADLDIGDSVHVENIELPEGVEVLHDVNFTILTIAAPTKLEEAVEAAVIEEAGEEAEAEAEDKAKAEDEA